MPVTGFAFAALVQRPESLAGVFVSSAECPAPPFQLVEPVQLLVWQPLVPVVQRAHAVSAYRRLPVEPVSPWGWQFVHADASQAARRFLVPPFQLVEPVQLLVWRPLAPLVQRAYAVSACRRQPVDLPWEPGPTSVAGQNFCANCPAREPARLHGGQAPLCAPR